MGRLFVKIFGIFALVIGIATLIVVVGLTVYSQSQNDARLRQQQNFEANILESALSTFNQRGEIGVHEQFSAWSGSSLIKNLYIIRGDDKSDLFGKTVTPEILASAESTLNNNPESPFARITWDRLGEQYLFYFYHWQVLAPELRMPIFSIPGVNMEPSQLLMLILAGSTFICGLVSFLVARNIARPIRVLQKGLRDMTDGKLETRIGERMSGRNDELGMLATDFDNMAQNMQSLVAKERHLLHHVSHEMRSPLARMQAILGLAQQQPQQSEKYFNRLESELKRMDKLVDELLTLSRLENTTQPIEKEDFLFIPFLTQLVADSQEVAVQKHQQLILSVAQQDIMVHANEAYLYRAFDNVVRNALRYSPENSEVTVRVARDGSCIVTDISDSGPGVATQELENIFTSFYRGQSSIGTTGTGLGLPLAKNVVEQHGGMISAYNLQPTGLKVTIRLPCATAAHRSLVKQVLDKSKPTA